MTANYEKEQKELLKLVADGKKNLLDAEQTKVDLRLLMKALRDYTDIRQLTPVGLFSIPTEKELQAAMEEIRQNPQQFKTSA